ncbi:hypothetical protein [Sinomicrobium soli]|uniref:hypothetical protein n=1 Tax=Sinomicrobium sp. N-1-3-6 TaxID=2219864 RepID=UPI0011BEE0BF|nr:hypothetical protein [Sinomicrobium sp. N-1-3-6]
MNDTVAHGNPTVTGRKACMIIGRKQLSCHRNLHDVYNKTPAYGRGFPMIRNHDVPVRDATVPV